MKDNIIRYARAGYAGLFLCTAEEVRAEAEVKAAAEELGRNLHAWSITTGMIDTHSGNIHRCTEPVEALESIESLHSDCVVVLRDFGALLEDKDPLLIRTLRDALAHARSVGKLIVLIGIWKPSLMNSRGCRWTIPPAAICANSTGASLRSAAMSRPSGSSAPAKSMRYRGRAGMFSASSGERRAN